MEHLQGIRRDRDRQGLSIRGLAERHDVHRRTVRQNLAFARFKFPPEVIMLVARWSIRSGLSYRVLEEPLTNRGDEVNLVMLFRRSQQFTPRFINAARSCWRAIVYRCSSRNRRRSPSPFNALDTFAARGQSKSDRDSNGMNGR